MRRLLAAAFGVLALSVGTAARLGGATGAAYSGDYVDIIALSAGQLGAPCLPPYTDFNCLNGTACADGTTIDGLCSPGSGAVCCVPLPDDRCRQSFGTCMTHRECTKGSALPGRCPGFDDVVCCVQDRRYQVVKVPSPTGPHFSVVSSHSGRTAFTATTVAKEMAFRSFLLHDGETGDRVAHSDARWSFSELWHAKLPVYDIHAEASSKYPASHWMLFESPNRRLSLLHLTGVKDEDERKEAEALRGFSERTLEGTWGKDLRIMEGSQRMLSIDVEASTKWDLTVHDVTGAGYPTLDPRVATIISMIADLRQLR